MAAGLSNRDLVGHGSKLPSIAAAAGREGAGEFGTGLRWPDRARLAGLRAVVAAEPAPPAGAPNVVLVVLDDVGYAQLGCYGSDIETPVLDDLAANGVRLSNFHTTSLCSPTRACLLTGRNHHRSGMGRVADLAVGYPGYWGKPPRENGYLSEILRGAGYATYAVGKWHLSPEDETNMAGSRATWPLGQGVRPLVRIPRRGDASVRPGSLPRQPLGAIPGVDAGQLSPHRRPGRPGDRVPV